MLKEPAKNPMTHCDAQIARISGSDNKVRMVGGSSLAATLDGPGEGETILCREDALEADRLFLARPGCV